MGREPPGAAMSDADGFLARWSRRKRDARIEEPAPEAAPTGLAPPEPAAADSEAPAPEAAEPPPDLADLPPVESLTPDSDLAPFLRPGVPAALKNAALRRMWLLDPVIAGHRDVAVDYAWDWNAPVAVPGFDGTISPDSVQALLDRLTGPAQPEPDRQADARMPDEASPAARAGSPDEPPTAALPALDPFPAPVAAEAPDSVPPLRPRRHGGAIPV
jgi:hypothetical protein